MKRITLSAFSTVLFLLILSGCGNRKTLDDSTAVDLVSAYLKSNPPSETAGINVGEVTFRSRNDRIELKKYKSLQENGLLEMTLQDQKKKFLSKDSVYVYQITLTDKSKPYVLAQDARKATVKALDYVLEEGKPTRLEVNNSKTARITVSLKKEKNDFSVLLKDNRTASNFITKTYKLKFKKDEGWVVTGE